MYIVLAVRFKIKFLVHFLVKESDELAVPRKAEPNGRKSDELKHRFFRHSIVYCLDGSRRQPLGDFFGFFGNEALTIVMILSLKGFVKFIDWATPTPSKALDPSIRYCQ